MGWEWRVWWEVKVKGMARWAGRWVEGRVGWCSAKFLQDDVCLCLLGEGGGWRLGSDGWRAVMCSAEYLQHDVSLRHNHNSRLNGFLNKFELAPCLIMLMVMMMMMVVMMMMMMMMMMIL